MTVMGSPVAIDRADSSVMNAEVILEARDLDTDERVLTALGAARPSEDGAQRRCLIELVRGHYPNARIKSYERGVATFLTRQELVIAHFSNASEAPGDDSSSSDQDSLFAA